MSGGELPKQRCNFCDTVCNVWIDGKTRSGPWAFMCHACWRERGIGLGVGVGQLYVNGEKLLG
jgi:hypothetical protein